MITKKSNRTCRNQMSRIMNKKIKILDRDRATKSLFLILLRMQMFKILVIEAATSIKTKMYKLIDHSCLLKVTWEEIPSKIIYPWQRPRQLIRHKICSPLMQKKRLFQNKVFSYFLPQAQFESSI